MKKFISMVMAAAMVVSLVPATAFAATGTVEAAKAAKVVDGADYVEDFFYDANGNKTKDAPADVEGLIYSTTNPKAIPQVKIELDDAEAAGATYKQELKIKLDGAKFYDYAGSEDPSATGDTGALVEDMTKASAKAFLGGLLKFDGAAVPAKSGAVTGAMVYTVDKFTNTSVTFILEGEVASLISAIEDSGNSNDAITFDLETKMNKTSANATAKVSVTSDIEGADAADLVYATVEGKGVDVELDDESVDVAPEEIVKIEDIVLEPSVGSTFADVTKAGDVLKLKLNNGFEWKYDSANKATIYSDVNSTGIDLDDTFYTDDDVIEIPCSASGLVRSAGEVTITGLKVEATDAKEGDTAVVTVKVGSNDSSKLEVATVVESGLKMTVDEDADVPVMWSGVNSKNYGLTADSDEHEALEVTIEETFVGAYNDKDEVELVLPEGVFVTGINFTDETLMAGDDADTIFKAAYKEGDHESFVFEKRAFRETGLGNDEIELSFEMTLVAVPGFVGDVALEMLVDGESKGEVVIAKFETPMTVEAEQNDLKIDYRNTEVGTDVVIKEAEAGLWDKENFYVELALDHDIEFEDDLVYTDNRDDSSLEVDGDDDKMAFTLDKESDDEAGVITISNISLYMDRNLAAGAYDLEMIRNKAIEAFNTEVLYGTDACTATIADADAVNWFNAKHEFVGPAGHQNHDKECYVGDVADYSTVVKEAFVNIVTAGREQDDASFTTKVVVPVGESYIIAGEQTVALDVPAYVSAAGYTMLPVRAVATALGINNNNVLWDQATKTVTILYGQRIITMTVGAKVINVNGSAIPASASVEVVNGRTFLPMRDLATALGVTDITWDAATKTATLNGNI